MSQVKCTDKWALGIKVGMNFTRNLCLKMEV